MVLCALTRGTTASSWAATTTIDNNLKDIMDVEAQEVRATMSRGKMGISRSPHFKPARPREVLGACEGAVLDGIGSFCL